MYKRQDETIANISKLFGEFGSNVWFEKEADELVPEGFTCPHCGGKHFDKETDTLDRKSTRLNSSHLKLSRMPSSA